MAAQATLAERGAVVAAEFLAGADLGERPAREAPTVVTDPRPAAVVIVPTGTTEIAAGNLARPRGTRLAGIAADAVAANLPAGAAARPIQGRRVFAGS